MQKTTPLKSGVALFCGVWFDAYLTLTLIIRHQIAQSSHERQSAQLQAVERSRQIPRNLKICKEYFPYKYQ